MDSQDEARKVVVIGDEVLYRPLFQRENARSKVAAIVFHRKVGADLTTEPPEPFLLLENGAEIAATSAYVREEVAGDLLPMLQNFVEFMESCRQDEALREGFKQLLNQHAVRTGKSKEVLPTDALNARKLDL